MTAKEPSIPDPPVHPVGLRERKKIKTRKAIRREAYRLFAEHGYEATTVDRIAEAAEISPSTFFRYFPTKEDLVLSDEYEPLLAHLMRTAPAGKSLVEVVRGGLLDALREVLATDREEVVTRLTLIRTVPTLRARSHEQQLQSWQLFARAFAERTGRDPDDLELRVAAASINAAMTEAVMVWGDGGYAQDPVELLDRALRWLGSGMRSADD